MLIKYYLDILAALISKAVWFLQLYISQYKELLIFIAVFVVLYIFFMHWLNVRFLNRLRQPAALISLAVELAAIAAFTLMFREVGTERQYELEFSQYYFRLGLFEFDDIFNNVLGALIGWSVFHILQQVRGQLN
ncbi:MAG TPA: hypothetical protein H9904_02720 [Candidatus Mediterraneibacter guildfordensis]|jgi:hypothetical protein|nr:hypothetical protein [Candidatus Mediterraneibacter guildfordensis]